MEALQLPEEPLHLRCGKNEFVAAGNSCYAGYLLRDPKRFRNRIKPKMATLEMTPNTAVEFSGESTHPSCA
jgi:hypothetical protein